jgi:opacity protein-like surface antigen
MRSAAKHLALIPLAAACAMSAANAAEVQSPKIIIDNLTGQQIPITGTVSFQADGDLRVQCRLDNNNNCPSIGTGNSGSGTNPPTISSFNASATTITAGQSVTLSWNSTGDVCYAESPAGITGWSGQEHQPDHQWPRRWQLYLRLALLHRGRQRRRKFAHHHRERGERWRSESAAADR